MSDPSAAFEKAVAHISSSNVAASNDVKLEVILSVVLHAQTGDRI